MRKLTLVVLFLAAVVWFVSQPRAAEQTPAVIAKFEYRVMTRGDIEKLAPGEDKNFEGMRTETLTAGLTKLGEQGWDLAAIEPFHSTKQRVNGAPGKDADGKEIPGTGIREVTMSYPNTYIFKRPK